MISGASAFASALVAGVDSLALGLGFFAGFVVSSLFADSELVWAPPVLTTSPGDAGEVVVVVDPVVLDEVVSELVGCSVVVESEVSEVVDDSDVDDDASTDDESVVSAHATGHP